MSSVLDYEIMKSMIRADYEESEFDHLDRFMEVKMDLEEAALQESVNYQIFNGDIGVI
jgi:hypothetical protein